MSKEPQIVLDSIYAFPPNRHILGGTSYLIVKNQGNVLIDCPLWHDQTHQFIEQMGGVSTLILTHRGGISPQLSEIYEALNCEIWIQEQEAYLIAPLPVQTFCKSQKFEDGDRMLWTPGHSPGASCFYSPVENGVLFTGRHLLPDAQGRPQPLKMPKTFHWPRQLASINLLLQEFSSETLSYLLPGANVGLLRGKRVIPDAYTALEAVTKTLTRAKVRG